MTSKIRPTQPIQFKIKITNKQTKFYGLADCIFRKYMFLFPTQSYFWKITPFASRGDHNSKESISHYCSTCKQLFGVLALLYENPQKPADLGLHCFKKSVKF